MTDIIWPSQAIIVREWLKALGWTQRHAANVLGVRPRDMRYYCAGRKYMPTEMRNELYFAMINKEEHDGKANAV